MDVKNRASCSKYRGRAFWSARVILFSAVVILLGKEGECVRCRLQRFSVRCGFVLRASRKKELTRVGVKALLLRGPERVHLRAGIRQGCVEQYRLAWDF